VAVAAALHCSGQALVAAAAAAGESAGEPGRFDVLVVRAVAPLVKLLGWFEPVCHTYGRLLVIKGPRWEEEKGEAQKVRLVELVTGRGDPGTFLAMLDREARATGVQLDLYEPQAPSPVAPPPTPRQNPAGTPAPAAGQPLPGANAAAPAAGAPAAPPGAPTEIEGLQRRTVLMAARGSYPALLNFLRRVEALESAHA
jgi:hypothetical protein